MKFKIPSAAALGKIGEAYTKAILKFAERHHLPRLHFPKGKNKEEVAHPYWEAAAREGKDREGCSYKSSRIKQYCKKGRALRSETVIRDTHDFRIGRRVGAQNGYALRAVGESVYRCRWDAEAADAQPAPNGATFCRVTQPSTTEDGLYAPGLCFGEARVMAVLAAWVRFCHRLAGFSNRPRVKRVATLGAVPYHTRQATDDLRRLKRKGRIAKLPHSHRYQLTSLGRRVAVLFTKTHGRVLAPGLSALDLRLPEGVVARSRLTLACAASNGLLTTTFRPK